MRPVTPNAPPILMLDGVPLYLKPSAIPGIIGAFVLSYAVAAWMRPKWPLFGKVLLAATLTQLLQAGLLIHSAGHIRSARQVGAPMQAVALDWGFQSNQYADEAVTPRQHIGRAMGGPVATALATGSAGLLYTVLRWIPIIGAVAEGWLYVNAIILAGSVTPTPHFDAGTIIKWGVAGATGEEALGDEAVQTAGSLTVGSLLLAAAGLIVTGKWRVGLAALVGAVATGLDLFWLRGRLP
jgi:hypothetical protein